MTRDEVARRVAARLAERVRRVAPPGLGRWDGAWALVEAPSVRFLDVLNDWQHADPADGRDAERKRAVTDAANEVIAAWRVAAERWQAAGRPETWPVHDDAGAVPA